MPEPITRAEAERLLEMQVSGAISTNKHSRALAAALRQALAELDGCHGLIAARRKRGCSEIDAPAWHLSCDAALASPLRKETTT